MFTFFVVKARRKNTFFVQLPFFGGIPQVFLGCVLDRINQKSLNLPSKNSFFYKNMQICLVNSSFLMFF